MTSRGIPHAERNFIYGLIGLRQPLFGKSDSFRYDRMVQTLPRYLFKQLRKIDGVVTEVLRDIAVLFDLRNAKPNIAPDVFTQFF